MPAERPREHAPPVAAARRRRLRADRARQLADLLRHQVLTGGFPGGVLPLEDALGQDYGTSRNTVRQALDLLRSERLVERQPGVGTVVVAEKYLHGLDRLMGLAETLHEHGRVTNEVRTVGPVPAPACVADRLGVPARSDVLYVERLRRLGGLPLSLDLTYLPMDIGADLIGADLENTDVFRLIEKITGQPLGTAEITLEAVNADSHSAAVLQAPRGAAVLMLERLTHLCDGRPVDLEFIRFRGDRITMSGQLRRTA
ncbi:GntR family transcriptional regulator [Streptomyces iranensis]|uniref:GntR family transcriptional regulator n=1 Tax=Streptomyces iranensis TaxID=576784 RepID=A0A060ZNW8_9ACTN|nr:GntR family transcriptional regulator [Streptomyces iranensis]MBP2066882.1 GntR family transcriptional regulator [Streptomyces iranensis]CDR07805.1 transcriptional regulator, GntR family with UTRAsensor domain [Streptomyces iranensis]